MKRISLLILTSLSLSGCTYFDEGEIKIADEENVGVTRSASTDDYYWGSSGRIPITRSSEKSYVLFKSDAAELQRSLRSANISAIRETRKYNLIMRKAEKNADLFAELSSGVGNIDDIANLKKLDKVIYAAPFYKFKDGDEFPLTNLFYVELKVPEDIGKLERLAAENSVNIVEKIPLTDNAYTLSCDKNSTGNALEMANLFYETGFFLSSAPEFLSARLNCVNDEYFSQQWNLSNSGQSGATTGLDINLCNARSISTGSNDIIVALIDDGVHINHPDLNVASVHDTTYQIDEPAVWGPHGMACAGIIAATTNNGRGVAGIAPGCKLMSISVAFEIASTTAALAYAIRYAVDNGAHVISNSYGGTTDSPIVNSAIKHALQNGREGKGCVVVFSSGNKNTPYVDYPNEADPDIIVVGAMTPQGERKSPTSSDGETDWGSNYGAALDVVAPGVKIYTTDAPGIGGYEKEGDYDYTDRFRGTSAACPHVSGIAALILSQAPFLTQKQVGNIIEKTARKVGNYYYGHDPTRTNGTWNNEMGYGLVDAYAALDRASSIVLFENRVITSNFTVTGNEISSGNITVSNNATFTMSAPQGITIFNPLIVNSGSKFVMGN